MNSFLNDTQALAPVFDVQQKDESEASWRLRASQVMSGALPAGMSANRRLAEGPDSLVAARAHGAHIWDMADRKYIDYVCGLGTVLLGHADQDVNAAISAQLDLGMQIAATHHREIQLAEELCDAMPGMDAVRFQINNTAAAQTALRIARVATSRELIVRFAGHHYGNLPLGTALVLPWNDATSLEAAFAEHGSSIAALIAEPVMASCGGFEPAPGFLTLMRKLCTQHQAIFILNESISGLRLSLQGAIGKYLLTGNLGPDLVICGQSLGNGAPIGGLAGKAKLMELLVSRAVAHSGTFNGSSIGVAAALSVLARLRIAGQSFYQSLTDRGRSLMAELERLGREAGVPLTARGPGPVFWVDLEQPSVAVPIFDIAFNERPAYRRFRHSLLSKGVRVMPGGTWYLSASHSDADVELTLATVRAALGEIGTGHDSGAGVAAS